MRCNEDCLKSPKNGLFGIVTVHFDLIIVIEAIYEGKYLVSSSGIDQHIYVRQWKLMFWTYFINVVIHCSNELGHFSSWQVRYQPARLGVIINLIKPTSNNFKFLFDLHLELCLKFLEAFFIGLIPSLILI